MTKAVNLIERTIAKRKDSGLVANDGRVCASAEVRDWHNDLLAWKAGEQNDDERKALEARRKNLCAAGHNCH